MKLAIILKIKCVTMMVENRFNLRKVSSSLFPLGITSMRNIETNEARPCYCCFQVTF